MPEQIFYTSRLLAKQMLTSDILEFRLERPQNFNFIAGQFVQFRVPDGDKFISRSYSIASTPSEDYLEFCVKIIPQGKASGYFSKVQVGEEMAVTSAQGLFTCSSDHSPNKMFIATGAGIVPIASMIGDHLALNTNSVQLLFGVRTPTDVFWADRLRVFQDKFSNFSFHITLSRPDDNWNGLRGRVTAHLQNKEFYNFTTLKFETQFYICGSVEMVKDVRLLLSAKGVNTKSIHFEIF